MAHLKRNAQNTTFTCLSYNLPRMSWGQRRRTASTV